MIHSMTAYAVARKKVADWDVGVEMRSVNNRFLDIVLRLPNGYGGLEEAIKKEITHRFTRGRIEIRVEIAKSTGLGPDLELDAALADTHIGLWTTLKERYGLDEPLSLKYLLGIPGVIRSVEPVRNPDDAWPIVQECIEETASAFQEMRKREGDFIAADLRTRMGRMEALLREIADAAKDLPVRYRERLLDRIRVLTDGAVVPDATRLAQEVAFMADHSDISEEILRMASHLKQFETFMDEPEPAGKKINFLLQELNREVNTIGAKADETFISHRVVAIKTEIEKIREQVQNIE